MSSSSSTATLLQPLHIRRLMFILRRSNAHYTHVASRIRASFTPTRHAKTHAQNLGLTIDVVAAVNCPHKQVSVIPLPIIEVVTPPAEVIRPQSVAQKRPVLTCSIPQVVQTITSPNGTTSALSSGSVYSSVTLPSCQLGNANVRSHWSAISDDGDLFPRDATDVDSINVRVVEQVEPPAVWQPLDVSIDEDAIVWDMDLQYPEDSSPSMDVCNSPSSGSEAGSESFDSSESSESSFSGPVTPPEAQETLPLMIRIKRKSIETHNDSDDEASDKRMRVFQDEEPHSRFVIRIPARR
ncbi:hypothetical protein C0995_005564 [Termitomyces sp. Mi166|nr:hypothetical protein C0995_005564 [Termitomyces sp. Mi166\